MVMKCQLSPPLQEASKWLNFVFTFGILKNVFPIQSCIKSAKEFQVIPSIRRADVRETTGWMDVEFTGEADEIDRAIIGLREKGCIVDPIELNVVE